MNAHTNEVTQSLNAWCKGKGKGVTRSYQAMSLVE